MTARLCTTVGKRRQWSSLYVVIAKGWCGAGTLRAWSILHLLVVVTVSGGFAVLGCGGGRADERRYENGRTYMSR